MYLIQQINIMMITIGMKKMSKIFQSFLMFSNSIYNAWFSIFIVLFYFILSPILDQEYNIFLSFIFILGLIIELPKLYKYFITKSIDKWGNSIVK